MSASVQERRSFQSSSLRIFEDIRTSDIRESVEFSSNLSDVNSFKRALKRGHIASMHGTKLQFKANSSFYMEILVFEYILCHSACMCVSSCSAILLVPSICRCEGAGTPPQGIVSRDWVSNFAVLRRRVMCFSWL